MKGKCILNIIQSPYETKCIPGLHIQLRNSQNTVKLEYEEIFPGQFAYCGEVEQGYYELYVNEMLMQGQGKYFFASGRKDLQK